MPAPMSDFDPGMLPPQPEIIPPELRQFSVDNTSDWSAKVPPQALGMFIAAMTQWLSHPRFGAKVTVDTHNDGWTIHVSLVRPEIREDLMLDG